MHLVIAGKDRTADLGAALRRDAEAMARGGRDRTPPRLPPAISALVLRQAGSDAAYLDEFLRLLRYRDGVDTCAFAIPGRPGPLGRLAVAVRRLLWRLLRYQHDRMAFRQNLINSALVSALEFEQSRRRAACDALERRLAALELPGAGRIGPAAPAEHGHAH